MNVVLTLTVNVVFMGHEAHGIKNPDEVPLTLLPGPLTLEETQLTSSPRILTEHLVFPRRLGGLCKCSAGSVATHAAAGTSRARETLLPRVMALVLEDCRSYSGCQRRGLLVCRADVVWSSLPVSARLGGHGQFRSLLSTVLA